MKARIAIALAAVLLTAASFLPMHAQVRAQNLATPLLVIVGSSSGLLDVPLSLVRRAFSGERAEYADGKRLIPFNMPPGAPERELFDRVVLGVEPADLGRFWINRRIRGEGEPPRTLPSLELGLRLVASFPGAITYVSAPPHSAEVRVLTIDGRSFTDPGYAFGGR